MILNCRRLLATRVNFTVTMKRLRTLALMLSVVRRRRRLAF